MRSLCLQRLCKFGYWYSPGTSHRPWPFSLHGNHLSCRDPSAVNRKWLQHLKHKHRATFLKTICFFVPVFRYKKCWTLQEAEEKVLKTKYFLKSVGGHAHISCLYFLGCCSETWFPFGSQIVFWGFCFPFSHGWGCFLPTGTYTAHCCLLWQWEVLHHKILARISCCANSSWNK